MAEPDQLVGPTAAEQLVTEHTANEQAAAENLLESMAEPGQETMREQPEEAVRQGKPERDPRKPAAENLLKLIAEAKLDDAERVRDLAEAWAWLTSPAQPHGHHVSNTSRTSPS
jgi:hypothetical protein